ncbi:MAG TPA: arginine deiminase-related protein [Candidatus Saccharimonadales bacterium]|nr:arginine deiminase-related protein [Candidatus Saccharimonadales bacterium]
MLTFPFNHRVLVSDARYIQPKGINALENTDDQPDVATAIAEHQACVAGFKQIGISVEQVPGPADCQDGVFTANWGLAWNGRALLSRLPNARQAEEPHAEATLRHLGFETKRASVLFSGQGDAMIIGGGRVLIGGGYRTDPAVASEIRDWLGLEPIMVPAQPKRRFKFGPPVRNRVTGLWDSFYYDIDLAIGVIRPDLIAVCLDALTKPGRAAIANLKDVEIIPVDLHEARDNLATNLVSTGQSVVMVDNAPKLTAELRRRSLDLILLPNHELKKSGGGFRCSALSLYS